NDSSASEPQATGAPGLAREYARGTVFERFVSQQEIADRAADLNDSLRVLLEVYRAWVSRTRVSSSSSPWPNFSPILGAFNAIEAARSFIFEGSQLEALHTAWTCNVAKRFVILSGLSGIGKTALVRNYALTVCALLGLDPQTHVVTVPVSPEWRDP